MKIYETQRRTQLLVIAILILVIFLSAMHKKNQLLFKIREALQ